MNTAQLNSFEINGGALDAIQRSIILAQAVAQVSAYPRVWARGLLNTPLVAQASSSFGGRMRARSALTVSPSASISTSLRNYTTSPTALAAQASVFARGESYPRGYVSDALVWPVTSLTTFDGRMRGRSVLTVTPEASVYPTPTSFRVARGQAAVTAVAEIWLAFEVNRRIPYDEDTVDERTMIVPPEDRTVIVS